MNKPEPHVHHWQLLGIIGMCVLATIDAPIGYYLILTLIALFGIVKTK